jgi:hypothetical protein
MSADDLEDLMARRQAMMDKLTNKLAAPVEEAYPAFCGACAEGQHAKCKGDVFHELAKRRVPCACPLCQADG